MWLDNYIDMNPDNYGELMLGGNTPQTAAANEMAHMAAPSTPQAYQQQQVQEQ
jgi:hypothetical protein